VTHPAAEVIVDDHLGVRIARVGGVLDVFSAGVVGARILDGLPSNATELILELDRIEFMDSAGVSALVRLREHARLRALNVHVQLGAAPHVNPTVVAVLRRVFVVDDVVDLSADDEQPGDQSVDRSPVSSTG
jgi:anti-anti-sigma factor